MTSSALYPTQPSPQHGGWQQAAILLLLLETTSTSMRSSRLSSGSSSSPPASAQAGWVASTDQNATGTCRMIWYKTQDTSPVQVWDTILRNHKEPAVVNRWFCLTLSCISLSMISSPAIWLDRSGLGSSSKVSHGAWTEATRAATPTTPSIHPGETDRWETGEGQTGCLSLETIYI